MAHHFNTSYVSDSTNLFFYYKRLGERAIKQCPDQDLFAAPDAESNSIAILVKHMAGSMRSRWTDFLISDGEKPDRNRDSEFEDAPKTCGSMSECKLAYLARTASQVRMASSSVGSAYRAPGGCTCR